MANQLAREPRFGFEPKPVSSRRLIVGVSCCLLGLAIAHPAYGDTINGDASADVNSERTAAEGVLFVGWREEPIAELPSAPARAGSGRRWTCHFYSTEETEHLYRQYGSGYQPGDPLDLYEKVTPLEDRQYILICTDENDERVVDRIVTYNPANPAAMIGEGPTVDWDAVRARVAAVRPKVQTSPPRDRSQLVNVETWFWIENWDEVDGGLRDAGSVAGFDLTITASNVTLRIDPGDGRGQPFTCTRAQMTVWSPNGPDDTDCGYTYLQSSADAPGGAWPVKATLVYDVTWAATGPDGAPLAGSPLGTIESDVETVPLVVREYQAVIR